MEEKVKKVVGLILGPLFAKRRRSPSRERRGNSFLLKFISLPPSRLGVFELVVIWGLGSFGIASAQSFMFRPLDRFDNITDLIALREVAIGGIK